MGKTEVLFVSLLFSTFERLCYQFCQLLKFVCIIQFVFHITDTYSHCFVIFSAPCQMTNGMPWNRFIIIVNIFSDWKETVKPPEEVACWASDWLILRRLHTLLWFLLVALVQTFKGWFFLLLFFRKLVGLVL